MKSLAKCQRTLKKGDRKTGIFEFVEALFREAMSASLTWSRISDRCRIALHRRMSGSQRTVH
jgi:hypothetical protein